MIISFKYLPWEECLRRLRLPSLVYKRLKGDMIITYKYIHGIYKVSANYIEHSDFIKTRGHQLKLKKKTRRCIIVCIQPSWAQGLWTCGIHYLNKWCWHQLWTLSSQLDKHWPHVPLFYNCRDYQGSWLGKNLVCMLDRFAKTASLCDSIDSILTHVYPYFCSPFCLCHKCHKLQILYSVLLWTLNTCI